MTRIEVESSSWPSLVVSLILMLVWVAGVVLAKGFWSTLIAVVFPPWALYLVVERGLMVAGWINATVC